MRRQIFITIGIFILISVAFCWPIYKNFNYWGQRGWDETFFWNGLARETILHYHQFPLWNPYSRGGMVFLGYPHSSFLSPMFIFVLLFGVVAGLKIEIVIYLFLGLLGMYLLSRFLELSRISLYLSSFVYNLSSMYALHLTEGHAGCWLVMGFLPWFFLVYLKSVKDRWWLVAAAVIFSLFIASGSIDVTSITVIFLAVFSLFSGLKEKSFRPIVNMVLVFLCSGLLIMVKFLPMCNLLAAYPRVITETEGTALRTIMVMLLSRKQAFLNSLPLDKLGLREYWHEYGAYIGVIPLALSAAGLFNYFKRFWPLAATGLISFLIAMGDKAFINLWGLLHKLPFYEMATVPSRYMLGVILCLAIFSGLGLEYLKKKMSLSKGLILQKGILLSIILVVLSDLFMVNSPILKKAFTVPPRKIIRSEKFIQARNEFAYTRTVPSNLYPSFLANRGTVDGDVSMPITSFATVAGEDNYKGEVYLAGGKGQAHISGFTPNKVTVEASLSAKDTLVLNQNYYKGWRVIKNGKVSSAVNYNGLIASEINPKDSKIIFSYRPDDFKIGLFISIAAVCLCISLYIRPARFIFNLPKKLNKG